MLILMLLKESVSAMYLVIHCCSLGCVSIFIKKLLSVYNSEAETSSELKLNVQSLYPKTVFLSTHRTEVLWLCESLRSIGGLISHQQKNLIYFCASRQPTESGKEARLWKGTNLFWHCAGESGYIALFLVALLEGSWKNRVLWHLLQLVRVLPLLFTWFGKFLPSHVCGLNEMTHRTPAYPSISSPMICDVFQNHWLTVTPLFVIVVQLLSHVWLCDPMDYSIIRSRASLSFTVSQILLKLMSLVLVMPSNHLILYCPLLLLPSIFASIRIFSSESALCIRWPEYWNFSFSISPSN